MALEVVDGGADTLPALHTPYAILHNRRWVVALLVDADEYPDNPDGVAFVWAHEETTAWVCAYGEEECHVLLTKP